MKLVKALCVCTLLFLFVGVSGQTSFNVPTEGILTQTLTTPGTYKVYDDGGADSNHSNNSNGALVLNVPMGTTISGIYAIDEYAALLLYDGDFIIQGCSGYGSFPETVITSGTITFEFYSYDTDTDWGFDFTVNVPKICNDITVSVTNITSTTAKIVWSDVSPQSKYDVVVIESPFMSPEIYKNVTSPLNIPVLGGRSYEVLVYKTECISAPSSFSTPYVVQGIPWKDNDLVIPFCMEDNPYGITYPAGTVSEQVHLNYGAIGCLWSTPSPAWFIFKIDQPGDMIIEMTHSREEDIDFICWGPLSGISKQDVLNKVYAGLREGSLFPHDTGDRCSYSGDWREICSIENAQQDEWYLLLITNFSEMPGNISFNKMSGNATTSCTIIIDISSNSPICIGGDLELYVNNAPAGATFEWTGPNGFKSTSATPVIKNATLNNAGTYSVVMTAGGETAEPVSLKVEILKNGFGCNEVIYEEIIPDAFFTPNGDGENDVWNIKNIEYFEIATIDIYDRFGKLLVRYTDKDRFTPWDGTYLGNPMPSNDYWYIIMLQNVEKVYIGHFMLFRR